MDVTKPSTSLRNFTPISTLDGSFAAGVSGTTDAAHNEKEPVAGETVVNDQVVGPVMALPARSCAWSTWAV